MQEDNLLSERDKLTRLSQLDFKGIWDKVTNGVVLDGVELNVINDEISYELELKLTDGDVKDSYSVSIMKCYDEVHICEYDFLRNMRLLAVLQHQSVKLHCLEFPLELLLKLDLLSG